MSGQGSPGHEVAPRILQRTELDGAARGEAFGPEWDRKTSSRLVTVRDYGGGIVEVGYSSVRFPSPPPPEREPNDLLRGLCKGLVKRQRDRANLMRSVRRSRAQIRRKCMAGGLDHLLTLTYRENVTDLDRGWRDFKMFLRYVRTRYRRFPYVAVPELQKRGAVHFHLAVRGYQDVAFLRRAWRAVVGEGNIDVQGPAKRGASMWSRTKLACYLTKYVGKDLGDADGRQRYRVAEGIEIPGETRIMEFPMFWDFVAGIFDSLGASCAFHWKANDGPHGWACSW